MLNKFRLRLYEKSIMVILMKKVFLFMIMLLWSGYVSAADYAGIDAYALKAPVVKSREEMKKLVEYLTEPYHNDQEKARSLYAWIVYNIDYDAYRGSLLEDERMKQRLEKLPKEDILSTRMGADEDIANLYQSMGAAAGLNIQVIDGIVNTDQARRKKLERAHHWAAVKIADTWEYVDPTWGVDATARAVLEDVHGNVRYLMEVKKRINNQKNYEPRHRRRVDDQWFMTDKDEMIKTHFPEQNAWQLQEKKITKEEFLGRKKSKDRKK